jgi:hypothetical protein
VSSAQSWQHALVTEKPWWLRLDGAPGDDKLRTTGLVAGPRFAWKRSVQGSYYASVTDLQGRKFFTEAWPRGVVRALPFNIGVLVIAISWLVHWIFFWGQWSVVVREPGPKRFRAGPRHESEPFKSRQDALLALEALQEEIRDGLWTSPIDDQGSSVSPGPKGGEIWP